MALARLHPRRGFGVGCFHFKPRKDPPYRFDMGEYASEVRSALQRITTINNVEIEYDEDYRPYDVPAGDVPSLEDGTGVFPHPSKLRIRFDVYIPFRIQEEVSRKGVEKETSAENFRVSLRYTFHGPVAFVESLNAEGDYRPSTAVNVVRKYLSRELNDESSPVVFEFLGPSPFHAEFYLEPAPSLPDNLDGTIFAVEHLRTRGYSDIVFSYDSEASPNIAEALMHLYYEISDELGLFYEIKLANLEAYLTWEDFQESALTLAESRNKPGLRKRAIGAWNLGGQIHRLHTSLVRFEVSQLQKKHRFEQFHRTYYSTDEATYLQPFLDEAMKGQPEFPTRHFGQLIGFLEERRSRAVELLIVLIAAIVGGIAGSLVTLLAQK